MSSSLTALAGSWSSLPIPLTEWILDVIQSFGHERMTPVQASTIPLFMKNKDVVVEAVTGSGKTLAFVIPVIERLIRRDTRLKKHEIGALIISPTRELATQIYSIFNQFLSSQPQPENQEDVDPDRHPDPLLLVSSDKSTPAQDIQRFLELGSDIVVGTPGRIEEFLLGKGQNIVNVKSLEVLVMDEADRLLDLGFQATLTKILTYLPKLRRTGLFSATMTDADAISELVRAGLRNPARVVVKVQSKRNRMLNGEVDEVIEERRIPANLQNLYIHCEASDKMLQLAKIVEHETQKGSSQFIIYFATCACVDYFYRALRCALPSGANLFSLHGHQSPSARTKMLTAFSSAVSTPSTPSLLLATDVAARGLDLPHVDVVIQFDPPSDSKSFSHRCGRTARAGRHGTAWVLLTGREIEYVDFLSIRKIPVKELEPFQADDENTADLFLDRIRKLLLTDRAIHDMGAKAFVSFVRAYSKHEASYIFRVRDLDLVGAARCFGLLRLPKMPELKDVSRANWSDAQVEWDAFAYKDKVQEAKRLETLAADKTAHALKQQEKRHKDRAQQKKVNAAWSDKTSHKELKEKRREKRISKAKWVRANPPKGAGAGEKRSRSDSEEGEGGEEDGDDWDDLAKEERMAKKVRKGHATQKDFDLAFGDL
ncbi:ATP-dependent rRNA helicase spb4 [Pterulicium gracile]|uniref:ATP-dependent RNA helicase n=1 Tax=Pterulicium gracile TaxID=1884261 RepID=A0A5C3QH67_9AGAR|nr:ATP-dependent rRNA helicase spb4 [Pterula gracilis]